MKESLLLRQVLDYLGLTQVVHFRMNTQGIQHTHAGRTFFKPNPNKGMADILVIIDGFAIWIETKADRGIQSPAQKQFQAKIEKAGCIYIVAKNLDTVINTIHPTSAR